LKKLYFDKFLLIKTFVLSMSDEPNCDIITFSGFGNTDSYGQNYEGLTLTKKCRYVYNEVTFWNPAETYYVYFCLKYQDWRLASYHAMPTCQAFAKTPEGTGIKPGVSDSWLEWNDQWQESSGKVTCFNSSTMTCGPELNSSDETVSVRSFVVGVLFLLGCCFLPWFIMWHLKRMRLKRRMTEGTRSHGKVHYDSNLRSNLTPVMVNRNIAPSPQPPVINIYQPQNLAINAQQVGAKYKVNSHQPQHVGANNNLNAWIQMYSETNNHAHVIPKKQIEGQVEGHVGGTTKYNGQHFGANRYDHVFPRKQIEGEVEGQVDGHVGGSTTKYSVASALPPPVYTAPPPYMD